MPGQRYCSTCRVLIDPALIIPAGASPPSSSDKRKAQSAAEFLATPPDEPLPEAEGYHYAADRSFGITLLAGINIFAGVLGLVLLVLLVFSNRLDNGNWLIVLSLLLALIVGVGLWRQALWGYWLAIIINTADLATALIASPLSVRAGDLLSPAQLDTIRTTEVVLQIGNLVYLILPDVRKQFG